MKSRSWKLAVVVASVAVVAVLLGLTVHLMRSTSAANRELTALRNEVARQEREASTKQNELVAPITARIDDLSSKVKQQSDVVAGVQDLGQRVSKLEEDAREVPPSPSTAAEPATLAVPPAQPEPTRAEPEKSAEAPTTTTAPSTQPAEEPQLTAALSQPSEALAGQSIEAGRFVILQSGTRIGTEDFDVRELESGYALVSTLRQSRGLLGIELVQTVTLDDAFAPTRYQLRGTQDGRGTDIVADLGAERVTVTSLGAQVLKEDVQSGSVRAAMDVLFPSSCIVLHRAMPVQSNERIVGSALSGTAAARVEFSLKSLPHVTLSDGVAPDIGDAVEIALDGVSATYYIHADRVVGFTVQSLGLFAYREDLYPQGLFVSPRTVIEMALPIGVAEWEAPLVNQGTKIVGTLAVPSEATTKMTAILLLPDIGGYDRNGSKLGLEAKTLRDIARRMAQQGIASFRFDPRGVGKSEGDPSAVSLETLESDALLALIWLRSNPRVDPEKVYVVGYGYGSLVAQHLAAGDLAHGLALLAAPASPYGENWLRIVAERAAADGFNAEEAQALVDRERDFFEFVRTTTGTWADVTLASAQSALPWMDEVEFARHRAIALPLLRDIVDVDPLGEVRSVRSRLFVLGGAKDIDTPSADVARFETAATESGNQDIETAVVADTNHALRVHLEDATSFNQHLESEVSWAVLDPFLTWLGGPAITPGGGAPTPQTAS